MNVSSRRYFRLIIVSTLISVCIGCAQSSPEINSHVIQLVRVQNPSGDFSERLSVFVFWNDADGYEDIGSMSISHEDSSLLWEVTREQLMVRLRGKDRWIGSNQLAGPGGENLPEGAYRIMVRDLAGNEAVREGLLSRPVFPSLPPVSLAVSGDRWTLKRNMASADFSRTWFLLSGDSGDIVFSWRVPENSQGVTEGTMQNLRDKAPDAVSFQVYTENSAGTAGVLLQDYDME